MKGQALDVECGTRLLETMKGQALDVECGTRLKRAPPESLRVTYSNAKHTAALLTFPRPFPRNSRMITNVFSPRQVLLALLVAVFGACSAAASHADILRDLGSGDSVQEANTLLDADGFDSFSSPHRVLLGMKGNKGGGHSKGGYKSKGGWGGGHSKGGHSKKGGAKKKGGGHKGGGYSSKGHKGHKYKGWGK